MGDSPGKRLALFRDEQRLSQADLASILGVARSTIAFIETNSRAPTRAFLQKISERYNISADWLLNGHGDQFHPPLPGFQGRTSQVEPPDYDRPEHADLRFDGQDYAFAKRMNISVSAGSGLMPIEDGEADRVALPMAWFQRNRINSDLAVLVRVQGDSMTPTIPDGCLVLLHVIEKTVEQPGIYAFTRGDEAFIKRLIPSDLNGDGRPGTIMVMSDNPSFPPFALTGQRLNELRIVGRVRAVFTTF